MNTTIEVKPSNKYLLSRDDSAIEFAVEKLEKDAKNLNNLLRYMREFTEFSLQSLEDVKQCISLGPTRFIQEATVAKTDHQKLKALYGFVPEHDELIRMVPVSHIQQLNQAENLCECLRGLPQEDFNFSAGQFSVSQDSVRRITKIHTRYATRKEAELHRRIDALTAEIDTIKKEFGFDPLISEPYKNSDNPYVLLYRLVKNKEGITKYFQ